MTQSVPTLTTCVPSVPDHLCITATPSSGRGLSVAPHHRVLRGQVALSNCPSAGAISARHQPFTCACCFRRKADQSSPDIPVRWKRRCHICRSVRWCSSACQTKTTARHEIECPLLTRLKNNPGIPRDEREHIVILASILASMSTDTDVSGKPRVTTTTSSTCQQEILFLVEQDWTKPGSKKCRRVMEDAANKVHKWGVEMDANYPSTLSLQHLLHTGPMNDVGLWDQTGESMGRCVAPLFALTNHSCLPNCAQIMDHGHVQLIALRDLEAGDELTHSYVNLNASDRQQTMVQSWQFRCQCVRCQMPTASQVLAFDEEHVCQCGGVVLKRGMDCLCNALQIL